MGEPESVPKVATPEMLTAGPIGSVGRRFRLLCVNCAARFVDRPRRKGRDVAHGHGLIGIVQPGGAVTAFKRAGAARVIAVNVVQAVADAELVAAR